MFNDRLLLLQSFYLKGNLFYAEVAQSNDFHYINVYSDIISSKIKTTKLMQMSRH